MKRIIIFLVSLIAVTSTEARLGDTPDMCAKLYKEWVRAPLFAPDRALPTASGPGSTNLVYLSESWRIRIGFIDGMAHRLEYTDAERPMHAITPEEVGQILNGNGGTSKWRKITRDSFKQWDPILEKIFAKDGSEAWLRRDGAIAQLRYNGSRFFVESYAIMKRELEAAQAQENERTDAKVEPIRVP